MSAKTILASGFLLLGGALLLVVSSLDYSDFYSLFGLLFTLAGAVPCSSTWGPAISHGITSLPHHPQMRTTRRIPMKILDINELLQAHPYPGRGIVLGRSADGQKAVIIYFIMGRSGNSRNRIFEATGDGIRTRAYDESKMVDPSPYHLPPGAPGGEVTVVTNGDQTDTIRDSLLAGKSYIDALRTRCYEPDGPNYTPASPAWWTRTAPSACPS